MRAEFISGARQARERACAARQFANECNERAAVLLWRAEALLARFDVLERRMLLRSVVKHTQSTCPKTLPRHEFSAAANHCFKVGKKSPFQ